MEERSWVAARASIMTSVIRAGGSVETYRSWVKELEWGDAAEEENPGKGKKREWGENPLNDLLEVNAVKQPRLTESSRALSAPKAGPSGTLMMEVDEEEKSPSEEAGLVLEEDKVEEEEKPQDG